jgi:MFS family permease
VATHTIETNVPARLDRLPWGRFHWLVIVGLGTVWILDGLEVTIVGAVASRMTESGSGITISAGQIGTAAAIYVAGACLGALFFGQLTDRFGRKKLFVLTLAVYITATVATAFAFAPWWLFLCRFFTGAGIGGEYAAINSAIDELLPARVRGRADLAINSTYWLGTAFGALVTLPLLNPALLPHRIGWRLVFALGASVGLAILFVRKHVPESPRWLLLHGRVPEAERVVAEIEAAVADGRDEPLPAPGPPCVLEAKGNVTFTAIARVLLERHLRRTLLGLSLMIAQAFAYNGVFFTYALVLSRFYGVPSERVGLYLLPFAAGNLLGPLFLGHLFDSVGRRPMIALTYALSGVLIAVAGFGLTHAWLTAVSQTVLWCAVFFVASAAASSAYLTVSELFPVELRGMAIALFYAVGTAAGGLLAPALFGALLDTGRRENVFTGYLIGAVLMVAAAIVAAFLGVSAEGKSLETLSELD